MRAITALAQAGLFLAVAAMPCTAADPAQSFTVRSSTITLHIHAITPSVSSQAILEWVSRAAHAVGDYYQRFPVPDVEIDVRADESGAVHHGVTYEGRRITIELGQDTTAKDLEADWTMTHEMLHLALPPLDDDHRWVGEGLSDYVEPIARARAGQLPVEEVWRQLVQGLPKGLPAAGDQGLDHTHTWGRTYWGGALFWFLADVTIRERTQNQRSIRDALRAILDGGGNGRSSWDWEQVIAAGDRATGTTVLRELDEQMGSHPIATDLNALWKRLGISLRDGQVLYDDHASQAAIRRRIPA